MNRNRSSRAHFAIPLRDEDRVLGWLSLANFNSAITATSEVVGRLSVIADIVGNTLARTEASKALRESESLKLSLLESMPSSVAIIDKAGVVLAVNKHWIELSIRKIPYLQPGLAVGSNYLALCRTISQGDELVTRIQFVIDGRVSMFEIEYESYQQSSQWFRMTVMPLPRSEGGAVITHLDITQQKISRIEEQRLQEFY